MTIIIDAPAAIEAAIIRQAEQAGLSVSEYTLRALLTAESANAKETSEDLTDQNREARRKVTREMIKSGYFARTGLSTVDLFAERREDLRLETEREARHEAGRNASRT